MKVTREWMAYWFNKFNADYFGSMLPVPQFHVSTARTRLGSLGYKIRRQALKKEFYDYVISLSNRYEQTEREYQQTLLHEMIHYYIAYNGFHDTSSHGMLFRGLMNDLNARFGWNITVSSHLKTKQQQPGKGTKKTFLVLAIELNDDRRMLSVVSPGYAQRLERDIATVGEIRKHLWFTTNDAYFMNFPAVRSLRGRIVPKDIYDGFVNALTKKK